MAPLPTTGGLSIHFRLPSKGYALQSTAADVAKLTVVLSETVLLVSSVVDTQDVTRDQIVAGVATVGFNNLKTGSYTMAITAYDASDNVIGATSAVAPVVAGQTSTVDAVLTIDQTPSVAPNPLESAIPAAPAVPTAPAGPTPPSVPAPPQPAVPAAPIATGQG